MSNTLTIPERLHKILLDHLGVTEAELVPQASFLNDLGADSLMIYQLAIAIEEEFQVELEDAEVEKARTVQELTQLIQEKAEK